MAVITDCDNENDAWRGEMIIPENGGRQSHVLSGR